MRLNPHLFDSYSIVRVSYAPIHADYPAVFLPTFSNCEQASFHPRSNWNVHIERPITIPYSAREAYYAVDKNAYESKIHPDYFQLDVGFFTTMYL